MKKQTYTQLSEIANTIKNRILIRFSPGELIPSERKISEELNETHNKVHRAIQMLVREGVLNSSGCRRGIRLCKISGYTQNQIQKETIKLRFKIPVPADLFQVQVWQRVCNTFCAAYPNIEIEIVNDVSGSVNTEDLNLVWPPFLDKNIYAELQKSDIFTDGHSENDFIPGIMDTGRQFGKMLAVPISHSPGVFWGHRNMLRRVDLDVRDFNNPLSFFHWGKQLENSNLCAMGFFFYGFSYHAANYGLYCQRKNEKFYMDADKLHEFFRAVKPLISAENIAYSPMNFSRYFHRGQLALNANYLFYLPIDNFRFQLLGQPLHGDGFACQALFYLAIGANSQHKEAALEFIRFVLGENIQKMFFFKEIKFSVLKDLYDEQYKELSDMTAAFIPPFDMRGTVPLTDLDYSLPIGRYLYVNCADYLCDFKNLDITVERLSCIDINEIRQQWLDHLPDAQYRYRDYLNSW